MYRNLKMKFINIWIAVGCFLCVLRPSIALDCGVSAKNTMGSLMKSLFCSYDRTLRPVKNNSQPIIVTTQLHVKSYYFDEHDQRLTIYSWTTLSWIDEHLIWEKEQYDNIEEVLINSHDIWTPDISLYNSDNGQSIAEHSDVNCAVNPKGKVACVLPVEFTAHCEANYKSWPYDSQSCTLYFGSWMSSKEHLDYDKEKLKVVTKETQENPSWKIKSAKVKYSIFSSANESFPTIQYTFQIERHEGVDEIVVIVPALVLLLINLISLVMDGSQRLLIISLNIICHLLYFQHLAWTLPHNGDTVPYVLIFFRNSLAICTIILVETIIVQALATYQAATPNWVEGSLKIVKENRFGNILLFKVPYQKRVDEEATDDVATLVTDTGDSGANGANKPSTSTVWKTFAKVLDRFCLLFFFCVYFIMIFTLIPFTYA